MNGKLQSKKWATVMTGGSFSCAFGAGVHLALAKNFGYVYPDIIVASSGSCITASFYAANQADEGIRMLIENFTDPAIFIPQRFTKKLNLSAIMDFIKKSLDVSALRKSKIEVSLAITDYHNGNTKYYTNHEINSDRKWFEVMEASMALPYFHDKTVFIDGDEYVDGDISASMSTHIQRAVSRGAGTVIAINNTNRLSFFDLNNWAFFHTILKTQKLRKIFYQRIKDMFQPKPFYTEQEIICLSSDKKLPTADFNNSKHAIENSISIGRLCAVNNQNLTKFLTAFSL